MKSDHVIVKYLGKDNDGDDLYYVKHSITGWGGEVNHAVTAAWIVRGVYGDSRSIDAIAKYITDGRDAGMVSYFYRDKRV